MYRFVDLDGTIIFSHRYKVLNGKVVEYYKGQEQSFMNKDAFEELQSRGTQFLIPTTSRTLQQYFRVNLFDNGQTPCYALVDNGGILLVNGKIDKDWRLETLRQIKNDMERLADCEKRLAAYGEVKVQDEMVYFIKTDMNTPVNEIVKLCQDLELICFMHFNKLYICSRYLSKGNAINRFKQRYSDGFTIVAGDSQIDMSMLDFADIGIYANDIEKEFSDKQKVVFCDRFQIINKLYEIEK